MSLQVLYLYGVWIVMVFDVHFFLGNVVASPLGRLGTLMYLPLIAMMAVQGPAILAWSRGWVWYPAFAVLLVTCAVTIPVAANRGYARSATQFLMIYYVLAVATSVYVRNARQALPIIGILLWQFAWWALWGRASGRVLWHPGLTNFDGFGGLMVMGVAICFWFGVAVRGKWFRLVMFALAGYCVLGVIASFARGAFLSLVALGGWIWIRSPRKGLTAAAGIGGAIVAVGGVALLFGLDVFVAEIRSAFEEGASEGTGGLRWAMWKAAMEVFTQRPIFGVGGMNFGTFAAEYFHYGEIPEYPNPESLYGMNLHSSYFQILSEFGLVGSIAFIIILVDFQRRNAALRRPDAIEAWRVRTGGKYDLRYLALGLEAANVANLLSGFLYASLFSPWFYVVWAANRMLWAVTRPDPKTNTLRNDPSFTRIPARRSLPG